MTFFYTIKSVPVNEGFTLGLEFGVYVGLSPACGIGVWNHGFSEDALHSAMIIGIVIMIPLAYAYRTHTDVSIQAI